MVVNVSSSSTELSVYVPKFYGWFQYDTSHVARSYFPSELVFNMYEMSVMLNVENLYPGLHFKSHLPGCLFLKYT